MPRVMDVLRLPKSIMPYFMLEKKLGNRLEEPLETVDSKSTIINSSSVASN